MGRSVFPDPRTFLRNAPCLHHSDDEDANHNGRIDGDNGDGIWDDSEIWEELDPYDKDTDGDTFEDNDEKSWGYDPLSKDTDGDGLDDNVEDTSNFGTWDSATETKVKDIDTDGDGLTDKNEIDGWKVIIVYEASLEIKEEKNVVSNPLIADYDEDGISDSGEYENGTDPNDDDTDGDGFKDKYELESDLESSPTGIEGTPPKISDFNVDYQLLTEVSGPFWNLRISLKYNVVIEVCVSDFSGIEWINVDFKGIGEQRYYYGGLTEINNTEFKFSLTNSQAIASLFNSFGVNISAQDCNNNIGFKEENVPSFFEMILSSFLGTLMVVVSFISQFVSPIMDIIYGKIDYILNHISYVKDIFIKIKDEVIPLIEDFLNYVLDTDSILGDIFDRIQTTMQVVFDEIMKIIHNIMDFICRYLLKYNIFKDLIQKGIDLLLEGISCVFDVVMEGMDYIFSSLEDFEKLLRDKFGGIGENHFHPLDIENGLNQEESTKGSNQELQEIGDKIYENELEGDWWTFGLSESFAPGGWYANQKAEYVTKAEFPNRHTGLTGYWIVIALALVSLASAVGIFYTATSVITALSEAAATAELLGLGSIETIIRNSVISLGLIILGLLFTSVAELIFPDETELFLGDRPDGGIPKLYGKMAMETIGLCLTVVGLFIPTCFGIWGTVAGGITAVIQTALLIKTMRHISLYLADDGDGLPRYIEQYSTWKIKIYQLGEDENGRYIEYIRDEIISGLDPEEKDTDQDGIMDSDELYPGLSLCEDGELYSYYKRGYYVTNPMKSDTDGDGRRDGDGRYESGEPPGEYRYRCWWDEYNNPHLYGESSHLYDDIYSPLCHPSIIEEAGLFHQTYFVEPRQ